MDEETSITRRLRRTLGKNYFVDESPIGRAERVTITKRGELHDCPSKESLDPLLKKFFPDVVYELRIYPGGFFEFGKDDLVLTFHTLSDYVGHFVIFGNENTVMLGLVWRGIYPRKRQEERYVKLVKEIYRQFYQ